MAGTIGQQELPSVQQPDSPPTTPNLSTPSSPSPHGWTKAVAKQTSQIAIQDFTYEVCLHSHHHAVGSLYTLKTEAERSPLKRIIVWQWV